MPPKYRYTKEEIVNAVMEIIRENGREAVTARSVAKRLNSSPKIIFSQFESMDELWKEVLNNIEALYNSYIADDMTKGEYPTYKASGMAYIRFASEEKELFKLLFMRDRTNEVYVDDDSAIRPLINLISEKSGLTYIEAKLFHIEMWVWVHGVASMIATGYLKPDINLISSMLSDVYNGTINHFKEKKTNG